MHEVIKKIVRILKNFKENHEKVHFSIVTRNGKIVWKYGPSLQKLLLS